MLLMERSVDKYPYMTAILLEFLHFTVENYHPPQRDYIHQHVGMAGQALVDKGVIRYGDHVTHSLFRVFEFDFNL